MADVIKIDLSCSHKFGHKAYLEFIGSLTKCLRCYNIEHRTSDCKYRKYKYRVFGASDILKKFTGGSLEILGLLSAAHASVSHRSTHRSFLILHVISPPDSFLIHSQITVNRQSVCISHNSP